VLDAERAAGDFTRSGGGAGVVLRFSFFYGPDNSFTRDIVRAVQKGIAPSVGRPEGFMSSLWTDDAASAVFAALNVPAGVYNVTGSFDDLPSATSHFTGRLTLTQVSLQSGDLAGLMSLVLRVEDEIINLSGAVSSATVAQDGALAFELREGTHSWTFTGTKISSGIGSGRHTLSDESNNLSGGWEATQVTAAALRESAESSTSAPTWDSQPDMRPMKRF